MIGALSEQTYDNIGWIWNRKSDSCAMNVAHWLPGPTVRAVGLPGKWLIECAWARLSYFVFPNQMIFGSGLALR